MMIYLFKNLWRFCVGKRHRSKPTALRALLYKCYKDAYYEANPMLRMHQSMPQAEQYIKSDFDKWLKTNEKKVDKQSNKKS